MGSALAGALAGTLVTLVVLLRKLDLLRWHERSSIWEPTSRLFRSMGLHPYVPREVISSGRYRPSGLVRVVDYPDPYPNRATKIVTLEDLSEGLAVERRTACGGQSRRRRLRWTGPPPPVTDALTGHHARVTPYLISTVEKAKSEPGSRGHLTDARESPPRIGLNAG